MKYYPNFGVVAGLVDAPVLKSVASLNIV
jgi:hypothetical protein